MPGGLFGIKPPEYLNKEQKEKFEEMINKGLTGVTETTELAKPASAIKLNTTNLIFETGVALQLPVKVKLSNVFLGSSCYVGSEANPIILNLTTGTTSPPAPNKPIKGSAGELKIDCEGALVAPQRRLARGQCVLGARSDRLRRALLGPRRQTGRFGLRCACRGGTQHRDPHRQARRRLRASRKSKRIAAPKHT